MIRNERLKLRATLLNTMAASFFTVGVIAPIAAAIVFNQPGFRPGGAIFGIFLWAVISATLHSGAYAILGEMEDE